MMLPTVGWAFPCQLTLVGQSSTDQPNLDISSLRLFPGDSGCVKLTMKAKHHTLILWSSHKGSSELNVNYLDAPSLFHEESSMRKMSHEETYKSNEQQSHSLDSEKASSTHRVQPWPCCVHGGHTLFAQGTQRTSNVIMSLIKQPLDVWKIPRRTHGMWLYISLTSVFGALE